MIIKNAKLKNGLFDIAIENGKITEIGSISGANSINADSKKVIPGLIDIHIHGFKGIDVSDGRLEEISRSLALCGTTAWLPTTMANSIDNLEKITSFTLPKYGAEVIGFHLEGPYISKKRKGAQNEAFIKNPKIEEFKRLKNVRKITVAPELFGMTEFIKQVKNDCIVSIGHTDCDYETALNAIEAGASCLTHTFNAMPPFLHRSPGPVGAAFEKEIYAEVICDGRHIGKSAVLALYKLFSSDRMILISDAVRPAAMPDGIYDSGGIPVNMKDGIAYLKNGSLAGGSSALLECVKTAVGFGIDFYEAVKMASQTPAKLLGLNKGKIEIGYDADLIILNDDFSVSKTIIGGKIFK